MKYILSLLLLTQVFFATAQRPLEIQARVGYGIAVYKSSSSFSYDFGGVKLQADTTDGAVTSHVPIELRYEITERFNVGLDMKFGKYLYAPEDRISGRSNNFAIFGAGFEGVLFNASDTRLYMGFGINTGKLVTRETKTNFINVAYTETITWQGPGFKLNFGVCHFIKDGPVAINLGIGYDQHTFNLKSIDHDNSAQDLTNLSGELKVSGIELMGGLVFRFVP